jgi:hypothetical protein
MAAPANNRYEELRRDRTPMLALLASIAAVAATIAIIAYSVPDVPQSTAGLPAQSGTSTAGLAGQAENTGAK